MDSSSLFHIASWFGFFWLLGWALLPTSRRLFSALPDGGLTAGRVLFLTLLGVLLYWAAFWHVLPLNWSPYFFWLLPLCGLCPLRTRNARQEFKAWFQQRHRALLFSDAIFAGAFGFFIWVRARHPELNDLEKLMDSALLSALARSEWLPVENPWFSGSALTSYYHFGPFLGALPVRAFNTPLPIAYNLVQPIFSALFLSVLWSLGAALAGSARRGLIVMVLVALLGHFEPIRQWKNPLPYADIHFARLDWWSTSRVLPDIEPAKGPDGKEQLPSPLEYSRLWKELPKAPWTTNIDHRWFAISEYPAFTLFTGDLHAHFYALSLSVLFFCLCFAFFGARHRKRWLLLILIGIVLGAFAMTNTWDVPLYALLGLACALFSALPWARKYPARLAQAWIFLPLIPLTALPYLLRFKPQVSGVKFEIWPPAPLPFVLLWGGWLALWFVCILPYVPRDVPREIPDHAPSDSNPGSNRIWLASTLVFVIAGALLPVTALILGALALTAYALFLRKRKDVAPRQFLLLLGFAGLLGVLVPQFGYVHGFFGGGLRHQDTVFKFGLQGWLLLGTAASAGALRALGECKPSLKWRNYALLSVMCITPALCAASVLWTRVVRDAPRDDRGQFLWSLDGARWVMPSDRAAIEWLRLMSRPGERVLEAVGENESGGMGGDFSGTGRVSAFTGLATPLGWPQHVWMWGEDYGRVVRRWETVRRVYNWPQDGSAETSLRELNVQWVFIGAEERKHYDPAALRRLQNALTTVYVQEDTVILKVEFE